MKRLRVSQQQKNNNKKLHKYLLWVYPPAFRLAIHCSSSMPLFYSICMWSVKYFLHLFLLFDDEIESHGSCLAWNSSCVASSSPCLMFCWFALKIRWCWCCYYCCYYRCCCCILCLAQFALFEICVNTLLSVVNLSWMFSSFLTLVSSSYF